MEPFDTIFWICTSVLFFCYLGYGILLFLINGIKRLFVHGKINELKEPHAVTLIVASFNEAEVLESKIRNTLAIRYPPEFFDIIFVVDGSTDSSVEIIKKYPSIRLMIHEKRKGKLAAIKTAMHDVKTPVVIFSDANAMLNEDCAWKIVKHYADPKVGGVAGEKKIISNKTSSALREAEGLYWKYESFMKKQDADLNTVIGAAGELFSIRTDLFREIRDDLVLDDFIISMNICLQGYKIEYEPGAYASETPSGSLAEEEKRKVRISAGAYQSIRYLKEALNIFKHPLLSFQYIFRRFFRWTLCPIFIILLLISNIIIEIISPRSDFFFWALCFQLLFYLFAMIGWLLVRTGHSASILNIPFYFVFMNYCLIKGMITYMRGRQTVLWEKSYREPILFKK